MENRPVCADEPIGGGDRAHSPGFASLPQRLPARLSGQGVMILSKLGDVDRWFL